MNLLIAIPSKTRADTILEHTMRYVPQVAYPHAVFVEPQDYDKYAAVLPKESLQLLDENNNGLGYAYCAILRYAREHAYDTIFVIDDDIVYWTPGYGSTEECRNNTAQTLSQAAQEALDTLNRKSIVKAVGFPYRVHMHPSSESWTVNPVLKTCYMIRTEYLLGSTEVTDFTDLYTTLRIWVGGGLTMGYQRIGFMPNAERGKLCGENTGGLQSFDRSELAKKCVPKFQSLLPTIKYKRVDRPWKIEPDMADARKQLFPKKVLNGLD